MASSCLLNFTRYPPPPPQGGMEEDDDEVLSVGSETPPRLAQPCSPASPGSPRTDPDECSELPKCASPPVPAIGALKFSIANILKPEFGSLRRRASHDGRTAVSPAGGLAAGPAGAVSPALSPAGHPTPAPQDR